MTELELTAYCVKCKASRPLTDAAPVYLSNGRAASRGVCTVCGAGVMRIGATPAHEGLPKPEAAAMPARKTPKKAVGSVRSGGAGPASGASGRARTTGSLLVIVESPAKARTIGRFLGSGYDVRASVGHVRDLLRSRLSVDIENDFTPTYRVPDDKRATVKALRQAAADAREVYLATDPDREGEAIAWHLTEAAAIPAERTRRVVFHEITRQAISDAFGHTRDIDMDLVDAQQARRILDRLVGYQVSPLLWDRVQSRLSAGRVQSVALRLIVEREREIKAFNPVEYWSLDADLAQTDTRHRSPRPSFLARLVRVNGEEAELNRREHSDSIVADLEGAIYVVSTVKSGERRRRPNPPFTTSTLQQDAAQRLGMTSARVMKVAQELYEGIDTGEGGAVGLITYMRTDSVNVSQEAQAEARALITEIYGAEYLPPEPNVYRARAKNAQEAHEAIRPTSARRIPDRVRGKLTPDQARLYTLIWQRFVASQMSAAIYDTMTIEVEAGSPSAQARPYLFRASGSRVRFPGFLAVYSGGPQGPSGDGLSGANQENGVRRPGGAEEVVRMPARDELAEQERLPAVAVGESLDLLRLIPEQHFTQPPPRYTEGTLVKALEENGIGRPSTYAAIISTIIERGYVQRSERRLSPTELGFTVNDLLVKHFDSIFNVGFTAEMEEHLDSISRGEEEMVPVLRRFYYGSFEPQLQRASDEMEKVSVGPEKLGEPCPECGGDLIVKAGKFGKFVGCANYPKCRYTRPILNRIGIACPKDGGAIVERRTRQGRIFFGCENYPACDFTSWKRPLDVPCDSCGGLMVVASKAWAECSVCQKRSKLRPSAAEDEQSDQTEVAA